MDEFKLLVEEQLYEMDNDDDDMDLYDRIEMLYGIIETETNIEYKILMLIHLWRKYPVDTDIWNIMIESYKENPEIVKRVIQNIEDVKLIGMINELLEFTVALNQEGYKELIDCLRKKHDEFICKTQKYDKIGSNHI